MKTMRTFQALCLVILAAMAGSAGAQTPPPQQPAEHVIAGFRGAHFGMTGDEVHQAIAKDFKPLAGAVTEQDNPVERTKIIVLHLEVLDPGPGAANVSYILGATSHKLDHINVSWTLEGNPNADERGRLAAAGLQLAAYFRAQNWKPGGTSVGVPISGNGIVLFAGIDPKGAAIELSVTGIALEKEGASGPPPTGAAQLRISYSANIAHPDIATIPPGSF